MRILRIVRTVDPASGGPIEAIKQISPHLSKLGHTTSVVTLDNPSEKYFNDLPFEVIALGPVRNFYGYKRGLPKKLLSIAQSFDVVIVHGIWQYHSFAAWRAFSSSCIDYFVYTHGMLDPWFKRRYPLKHFKKWLYWPFADYKLLRDAKGVLFTTNQERLSARDSFWLYKANEFVVGYGTSSPPRTDVYYRDKFFESFPELSSKRIILFLSRIHPKKGVDLLLHAFASVCKDYPDLHLVIAGPDQVGMKSELVSLSQALCVKDRISWPGMLTGDLKWGAYHASDLFCLPSHQENFGIVVAEALACRLPVSISTAVNISDDIIEKSAGLVHNDDIISTTNALSSWLAMSDTQRDQMRNNARALFLDRFDFSSVAQKLIPVINSET